MARGLRAVRGPLEGRMFLLGTRTIIGRSGDADVQLLGKGVSRHHACLVENEDGTTMLVDLSSANGVYFAGQRIDRHRRLDPGDVFRIGDSEFEFTRQVDTVDFEESDTEADVKIVSGRAQERTTADALAELGCRDPKHLTAIREGWQFCPACGKRTAPAS